MATTFGEIFPAGRKFKFDPEESRKLHAEYRDWLLLEQIRSLKRHLASGFATISPENPDDPDQVAGAELIKEHILATPEEDLLAVWGDKISKLRIDTIADSMISGRGGEFVKVDDGILVKPQVP